MAISITRAQRDALYQETLDDLSGIGDIFIALGQGNGGEAQRLWERFEPQLRLLDQIGWDPPSTSAL